MLQKIEKAGAALYPNSSALTLPYIFIVRRSGIEKIDNPSFDMDGANIKSGDNEPNVIFTSNSDVSCFL